MQKSFAYTYLLLAFSLHVHAEVLVVSPIVENTLQPIPEQNNFAEGNSQTLDFRLTSCGENSTGNRNITLRLIQGEESSLDFPETVYNVPCLYNETTDLGANATIEAKMIGFVSLEIMDEQTKEVYLEYSVGITRPPLRVQDQVYNYGLMVLIACITFTFGITLDLQKVREHLRRPVAPTIGMCCQFLLMPLIGFCITLGMTTHESLKLGVFASAVAPGGGLSNIWIFVLKGDLDLSITMTFLSTIAALGFVPLWMYTLGKHIIRDSAIKLPITNMLGTLALIIIPVSIGILVNRFLPKVAKVLLYLQKPVVLLVIVFAGAMGVWSNLYAFKMVLGDLELALCTFLLPYAGGLFGFLIALACRQGRKIAVTIGIETAIQNIQIATILLRFSLPQPWADISSAIPIVMIVFTFTPFPIFVAIQQIYLRCIRKEKEEQKLDELDDEKLKGNNLKLNEKTGVDNPNINVDEEV